MLHILNCIRNDKFFDDLIDVLDASGDGVIHDFIFISDNKNFKFAYIKKRQRINIIAEGEVTTLFNKENYDAVVLHSISSLPLYLIKRIPKIIPVFWFAWGFDMYTIPVYKPLIKLDNLYQPLTKKIIKGNIINQIQHLHAIIDSYIRRKELQQAVKRIDYFSGVLPLEYDLMEHNRRFRAQKVEFNYFNLNSDIQRKNLSSSVSKSSNILVGNSCDATNNHLDVFKILHGLNLINNKIYCLLSYGGTKDYQAKVKYIGKSYFRDNFIPIEEFLPYNEFSNIIMSCGNVIMGHERQQAMGNIFRALWNGCKVYLSETSVAYRYLKELGLHLFTIQNDLNDLILNKMMPLQYVMENREILIKNYSPEICMNKIQKIYGMLENLKEKK
jgi:dTDP-N-acetylfucosamine:lipid II N-acetylfucosaminyltransferase